MVNVCDRTHHAGRFLLSDCPMNSLDELNAVDGHCIPPPPCKKKVHAVPLCANLVRGKLKQDLRGLSISCTNRGDSNF
jgi:hypothetical protein